jgi:G3E family GTPase
LDSRMHRYRLIEAVRCDVPEELLLSAGRYGVPGRSAAGPVGAATTRALETWSYETARPFRLRALRTAAARLPAGVYRAKGIVATAGMPDRPVIVQVVGRRVDLSAGPPSRAPARWAASRTPATDHGGVLHVDERVRVQPLERGDRVIGALCPAEPPCRECWHH